MAVMAFDFKVLGLSRQHIKKRERDREKERDLDSLKQRDRGKARMLKANAQENYWYVRTGRSTRMKKILFLLYYYYI